MTASAKASAASHYTLHRNRDSWHVRCFRCSRRWRYTPPLGTAALYERLRLHLRQHGIRVSELTAFNVIMLIILLSAAVLEPC